MSITTRIRQLLGLFGFTAAFYTCGLAEDTQKDVILYVKENNKGSSLNMLSPEGSEMGNIKTPFPYVANPAISPDGAQVLFDGIGSDRRRTIYLCGIDGTELRPLLEDSANSIQGAWSPKGDRISFSSVQGMTLEVKVVNADGTGLESITENHAINKDSAWSPDAEYIVYASNADGGFDVYTARSDGAGEPKRVTFDKQCQKPEWFSTGIAYLQYVSKEFPSTGIIPDTRMSYEIFLTDPEGKEHKKISDFAGDNFSCNDFDFSPSGEQIVCALVKGKMSETTITSRKGRVIKHFEKPEGRGLYIFDFDGTLTPILTYGSDVKVMQPSWRYLKGKKGK